MRRAAPAKRRGENVSSRADEQTLRRGRPAARLALLAAVVILANALGNFSMKCGLDHYGARLGASVLAYLRVLFEPWVALGIGLLILWVLARMALLSLADLSYVLPVTSVGYALNAILARVFLGEHMSAARWAGTLAIVAGVAVVGSTSARTTLAARTAADPPAVVPEEVR